MADYFDVPSFDTDNNQQRLFLRAADAGALAHARKKDAASQKSAGGKRGANEVVPAANVGHAKKQRTSAPAGPGSKLSKADKRGVGGCARSTPVGLDHSNEMPSGKNLGRRRRLREKRARERLAQEGGVERRVKPPRRDNLQRVSATSVATTALAPAAPTTHAERRREARRALLREKRRSQRDNGRFDDGEVQPVARLVDPVPAVGAPSTGGSVRDAKKSKKAPSMLEAAQARLTGAHFRWLNEQLYTRTGADSLALMKSSPELFDLYHEGFRRQTQHWPRHPLDLCIAWLHRCPAWWAVADIGCGDARLSGSVPQQVQSFDLVATQPHVVACNMAHLPVASETIHAAVFCLSLMSTDYGAAVEEAARVLAPGGVLWVAEVRSRFEGEAGGVDAFVAAVTALGFQLRHRDESDTMFAIFRWVKSDKAQQARKSKTNSRATKWPALKACEYKRR